MEINFEMQKKVELPFEIPKVCTYPYFTAILGILNGHGNGDIWLYNNYILFWMLKDVHHIDYWMDFKYGNEEKQEEFCSFIKKEVVTREDINRTYNTIIDFIVDSINKEKYVFASVNCRYIENWWEKKEKRKDYRHQFIIYGYDIENKSLTIADFIGAKHYKTIKVDFDDFIMGYSHYADVGPVVEYGKDVLCLLYNPESKEKVNLKRVCDLLDDYVNSRDIHIKNHIQTENKTEQYIYGIEAIKELAHYVHDIYDGKYDTFDIRTIVIVEKMHQIMCWRLQYIYTYNMICNDKKMELIIEQMQLLTKKINIIQTLCLKYKLSKKREILLDIEHRLEEFAIADKKILKDCYTCLTDVITKGCVK